MSRASPPLSHDKAPRLLAQRDPDPEPAHHFDKGKCEEDAIAQPVPAAPVLEAAAALEGHRAPRAQAAAAGRREKSDDGQDREEQDPEGRLRSPVVHEPDLLGEGEGQNIGQAKNEEEEREERGRGRRRVEGGCLGHAHGFA